MPGLHSYIQKVAFDKFSISISQSRFTGLQHEKYAVQRFLREFAIDCVFDVGANNGQYAALVRSTGYMGPIVSFEPIPALAERLKTLAAADGRWSVEEVALDESPRDVVFNIMAGTDFSSINAPKTIEGGDDLTRYNRVVESISLATETLGPYFDKYKRKYGFSRPFLKIDTQGADLAVAKGAGDKLKEFIGVQTELSIRPIYENQPQLPDTLSFFDQQGFALSAFLPVHDNFPLLVEVDCIVVNRARIADG